MASNTYTKNYVDGSALTEAMLDSAYQTLQPDVANTALMTTGSSSGQALLSNGSGVAASFQTIPDPQGPFAIRNYGLKATAAAGVLTISLKTKALATPSATDVVNFNYSTNGTTSASYTTVNVTAATTFTMSASASLGFTATTSLRVFVYGYYNSSAAAVKLAVSARSDFDGIGSVSATSMSASADSSLFLYASASLSVLPRLFGYVDVAHNSTGSWQTPSKVNIGNVVYGQRGIVYSSASSGVFTSSSATMVDVTNLSVTIISSGRPIRLELIATQGASTESFLGGSKNSTTVGGGEFQFARGTVSLGIFQLSVTAGSANLGITAPPGTATAIDNVSAGSHTYKFQARGANSGSVASVSNCSMLAFEM